MESFVARQPILDARLDVFGYEILYRQQACDVCAPAFCGQEGDEASRSLLRNVALVLGWDRLTAGRKAFINFTRQLILDEAPLYIPPAVGVVEILEDVVVDPPLLEACARLQRSGYLLAIDDFIPDSPSHLLLAQSADFIKVDFRRTPPEARREIRDLCRSKGIRCIAEKVETQEEFQEALAADYTLFQGFFFGQPVLVSRKDIPVSKLNYLRLICELNQEDISVEALEHIVRQDPSLVHKLLKYINSIFFGLPCEVTSVRQALLLLGEKEVRKWATLIAYTHLGRTPSDEVCRHSLLRAYVMESLASAGKMEKQRSKLFLMGIVSMLDVLLGIPLDEALREIPLGAEVSQALLGAPNPYRSLFELVTEYERANWLEVERGCAGLDLEPTRLSDVYLDAVQWVEQVFNLH